MVVSLKNSKCFAHFITKWNSDIMEITDRPHPSLEVMRTIEPNNHLEWPNSSYTIIYKQYMENVLFADALSYKPVLSGSLSQPNMLKTLPIIPSSTFQKVYSLFSFYSHIITYYSDIILLALFLKALIFRETRT